jgi:hypothetical protein
MSQIGEKGEVDHKGLRDVGVVVGEPLVAVVLDGEGVAGIRWLVEGDGLGTGVLSRDVEGLGVGEEGTLVGCRTGEELLLLRGFMLMVESS